MFEIVLLNYRNIMLEFLFELYIFCAFFFMKLERKPKFVPRLIAGYAVVGILALPVAWLYT